jgi:acetyl esterase
MELFRLRLTSGSQQPPDPSPAGIATMRDNAAALRRWWAESVPSGRERRGVIATRHAPVPFTIHMPVQDPRGTLLFLHGGGWTLLDSETHAPLMRAIAARTGWAVAGIDYPRAPEMPFPAPVESCAEVFEAASRGALDPAPPGPLAIAGDSAGANLAVAVSLALREAGQPLPAAMLLFYGVYSCDMSRPSYAAYGSDHYPLTAAKMAWFWDRYCPDLLLRESPLASPLSADLAGLPPTQLVVAGRDILRDDNLAMAMRLAEAGVRTSLDVYPDAIHAFCEAVGFVETSRTAVERAADWLLAIEGAAPHKHRAIA